MTTYEIWKGKKPNLKYFHEFGSNCFMLNDREHRSKFDAKSDEGIFLGYSLNNRSYRVYNRHTQTIMESFNVIVDDGGSDSSEIRRNDVETEFSHSKVHDSGTLDS